uniref:UNC93-like protein MFSD11 n=1 Tax=Nippostrongylus brasiliensis TaxID=27835 RepID=A0A0N4XT92_NIPBR
MGVSLSPSTLNVIQVGLGFFLNFFAFNSQGLKSISVFIFGKTLRTAGFIEETVIDSASVGKNINKHAGYYSLSIIYAVFTVSNIIAAPIVELLTPKWSMALGALCYAAFQAGFLRLNEIYLYVSSATLGFGAAILWTGQGTYLSQNSTAETSARNSALLWALAEGSLLGGGIFLFIIFRTSDTTDGIPDSTVNTLYGIFTAVAILSAIVFVFLRVPSSTVDKDVEVRRSTFSLMFTKEMLLMAFVFAYTGIEQSFWTGVYPTCISFSQQLGSNTNSILAIALICGGLLGFGDACWNTQIYAYLCDVHAAKSSEAFALFKFYQSGLSCAAFYYSSVLILPWQLVILITTSFAAAICFFVSERLLSHSQSQNEYLSERL